MLKCLQLTILSKRIVIFSRDELKQFEMAQCVLSPVMRYFIGDVRDYERVEQAM